MNSKQRRKQRRYLKRTSFQMSFTESNQGSVRDFFNIWTENVQNSFLPSEARERLLKDDVKLYPMEILNPDGTPLQSTPPVVEATISFDFKAYEQQTQKGLAEADPTHDVLSGSMGVTSGDSGSLPDHTDA